MTHRPARNAMLLGAALLAALPLLAAQRLAVKTGLWENTITLQLSGLRIPPERLAQMTPEQRTQAEALMKQLGTGAPSTLTDQSCLTEKDLDGNAFVRGMQEEGSNCEYQQVTGTTKRQEWTFQCTSEAGPVEGRMLIDVLGDARVQGTMTARSPAGNVDMKFEGNWKSSDCGDVQPDE